MVAAAMIEVVMGLRNLLILPSPQNLVMASLQALVVLAALLAWRRLRRRTDLRPAEAQRYVAAAVLMLGLLMPLEQGLSSQALLVANTGIMIVMAGAVLLSHRAFALIAAALVAGWLVAVSTRSQWDITVADQATLLAMSVVAGTMLHWNRTADRANLVRRTHESLERGLRDDLTGLWNRRGGRDVWAVLAASGAESGAQMWCIFLDVRGLKRVNDLLGHAAGDALLRNLGDELMRAAPAGSIVSRWGGDEFCLFGIGSPPDADDLAQKVRVSAERTMAPSDQQWGLSPGLSSAPAAVDEDAFWRLVDAADEDMYRRRSGPTPAQR